MPTATTSLHLPIIAHIIISAASSLQQSHRPVPRGHRSRGLHHRRAFRRELQGGVPHALTRRSQADEAAVQKNGLGGGKVRIENTNTSFICLIY